MLVISWYKFTLIDEPALEVERHRSFMAERGMAGRVYIADEGVNAQLSGPKEAAEEYMEWIHSDPRFRDVLFKVQEDGVNVFPRLTVKVKKQLVAFDKQMDTTKGGAYVTPKEWREMLESSEEYLKIDVRNDYEWDLGHFRDFARPECRTSRDFPAFTQRLKEKVDPKKTKVMMCCTGGIRCELYSVMMKEEGFEEVYQLEGGILKYGDDEKGKHWDGKLFVFDDRLAVDINQVDPTLTAKCHECGEPTAGVYNCADMDCNELFYSCDGCLEKSVGCCQVSCQEGERVRPLDQQSKGRPFRRLRGSQESYSVSREAQPSGQA